MSADQPPAPTPNVSETPRTDAARVESILCTEGGDDECTVYPCVEHVEADFARQLERELTAVTKERDEAIKAHGVVWNAVRRAASAFRWVGIPKDAHAILTEDAERIFAAEKLMPAWSTDWMILPRQEYEKTLTQLTAALARAEKADVALRDTVTELARMTEHATRWCGDGPIESHKAYAALNAARAALTPTKEPAP